MARSLLFFFVLFGAACCLIHKYHERGVLVYTILVSRRLVTKREKKQGAVAAVKIEETTAQGVGEHLGPAWLHN
jgi:hypothetical protein